MLSDFVKAIQENYQNPEFQKQLQAEQAENKKAMVASLKDEMLEKQNALIRQAVRATPELLEQAAAKITSGFVRERARYEISHVAQSQHIVYSDQR